MKTNKNILALLRAVRADSPYSSKKFKWEVGYNDHLPNPFAIDEVLGGFDQTYPWASLSELCVTVGTVADFYVYENEGDVKNCDWCLATNYVVTITSETTATIRDTGKPVREFILKSA